MAVPGGVLVGTNQHEFGAIEATRRFEPQNFERHAALARGFFEGACTLGRAEIEEREALAELLIGGAARRVPKMRRPRPRSVERPGRVPRIRPRTIFVGPHHRRPPLAVPELTPH